MTEEEKRVKEDMLKFIDDLVDKEMPNADANTRAYYKGILLARYELLMKDIDEHNERARKKFAS